jgi:RNA polymerase sigma factor (sigma-70 family)
MYQMTDDDLQIAIKAAVSVARSSARKAGLDDGHFEDMIQEALERIVRYAPRFNPDRGFKFVTYANVHATGAIRDYMRSRDTVSRLARSQIKVNGFAKINGKTVLDFTTVEIEKAYRVSTQMIDSIVPDLKLQYLDDKELVAVTLFLDGFLLSEIGDSLSVSESRINQIIVKACDKLRRAAEGKYVREPNRTKESQRFVQESVRYTRRKYGSDYYKQGE